ncbi:MAG TPA: hypothetical protein VHM70_03650 [Polyangiaceae bacterium]|jgi:hypothetical protein|nr:hypothetical protein [Polyangiaceae bacterium]
MQRVNKSQFVSEIKRMLADLFGEHGRGASGVRLARAHGYLDGYMRGLADAGVLTQRELLQLVSRERTQAAGPASAKLAAPEAA